MKLYMTQGSPYARMPRIVVIEKALGNRVEMVVVKTRQVDSPYYKFNPSGRVPFLLNDDGVGMEGSATICAYLDQVDGMPGLATPQGTDAWEGRRLEASAQGTLEGLAVWARELRRAENLQSPPVIAHEASRAARMLEFWEQRAEHPSLVGPFNMLQIVLACALGLEARTLGTQWRASHPRLGRWYSSVSCRPSFVATQPVAEA